MRIFFICLLVCAGLRAAPADDAPSSLTFRVMTFNIRHGAGLDGLVDLERIAKVITDENADLVGLQEVDKGVLRTQGRDLPAELAGLTGMTCIFTNNFHYQGGEYGNAVLSKFPVLSWTNLHYRMLHPAEQRGLLQTTIRIHGTDVRFLNTHLDFRPDDAERLSNVQEIFHLLDAIPGPIIICGDFNTLPGSRTHLAMKKQFDDVWESVGKDDGFTIPVDLPSRRIDYIFIRGEQLEPVRAWVPHTRASDHLPVVAEFKLRAAEESRKLEAQTGKQ